MTTLDPRADLYELLQVDPTASTEQIARAYRRLARRCHPDVTTGLGAADHFAAITTAYRVLSDPAARARYDAARAGRTATARKPPSPPRRPTGSTGRGPRWTPWGGQLSGADPEAFWLGGPSFSRAFTFNPDQGDHHGGAPAGVDAEVEISVEEAYTGTARTLTITEPRGTESVPVTIPPGVVTGQHLHVPVDHLPGHEGQSPVTLQIRLAEHERYRVEGRHVHLDLPLTPWEAALGGPVTVQTPAGQTRLQVPPGTSTGTVLTVSGAGLPNPAGPAGDLYAHVAIVVPTHLSATERDLFTQLARTSTFQPRARRGSAQGG